MPDLRDTVTTNKVDNLQYMGHFENNNQMGDPHQLSERQQRVIKWHG